jgi:RHS repeat-associated protein
MTDGTGAVVWSADYKPFGEATITVSTITNNLRFPGQHFDRETGLHYNYYRDYNPSTGRFIERDPIGLKGGINLYRYVKNNPLKYKDPRGLVWVYDQSTGTMVHVDDTTGVGTFAGDGYAGNGVGLNNPAEQSTPNVGPIPQGTYDIGDQRNSQQTGPAAMDLTPRDGTNTYGRDNFQIHGDNRQGDNSASRGCIVQNRDTRDQIQNSNDRILEVVP